MPLLGGSNLSNAFSAIFNLSGNNLLNGLTQISGETAAGSQQTTFHAMNQFMGMMTDPFIDGRGDGAACDRRNAYAEEDALAYAARQAAPTTSATPMPRLPRRRSRKSTIRAGACGRAGYGGSQTTDGNTARDRTTPPAACSASRPAPTIASRPTPSPALRWPAAAPVSASRVAAAAVPTCSRPAPSSATVSARPISPARWPMAGRTSPPIAP